MEYWDFDEDVKNNIKFLNKIDFSYYLQHDGTIEDIISQVEDDYNDSCTLPSWLQGCIFNFLTHEEIAIYLSHRYNLFIWEETVHHYTKKGN